jgi:hypothetical protein
MEIDGVDIDPKTPIIIDGELYTADEVVTIVLRRKVDNEKDLLRSQMSTPEQREARNARQRERYVRVKAERERMAELMKTKAVQDIIARATEEAERGIRKSEMRSTVAASSPAPSTSASPPTETPPRKTRPYKPYKPRKPPMVAVERVSPSPEAPEPAVVKIPKARIYRTKTTSKPRASELPPTEEFSDTEPITSTPTLSI